MGGTIRSSEGSITGISKVQVNRGPKGVSTALNYLSCGSWRHYHSKWEWRRGPDGGDASQQRDRAIKPDKFYRIVQYQRGKQTRWSVDFYR